MSFARVLCAQPAYPRAHIVSVEADLSKGLHSFTIVGLPDKAVEEARDRVSASIKHSGFVSPKHHNRKVVVSLAPAGLKKEGTHFDIAIAVAYLAAAGDIPVPTTDALFVGELALDGTVRSVSGVLSIVLAAKHKGCQEVYVPQENAREAALVGGLSVYGITSLSDLLKHLQACTEATHERLRCTLQRAPQTKLPEKPPFAELDFADIRGQEIAKRGLLIAAAGRHNITLFGPPGTGKTLLARAFIGILPPLSFEEALEATAIHSLAGSLEEDLVVHPPFRSPHHTSSYVSLVGGGANIRPGEVTLAHRGVLFLDEFPEFDRRCLDALRQPLEDRVVTISRARGTVRFPANFILIATMNPTPLGGMEDPSLVSPRERMKYQKKISGPIIDRIDMWIEVAHFDETLLTKKRVTSASESDKYRTMVMQARLRQKERLGSSRTNADMGVRDIDNHISLSSSGKNIMHDATKRLALSPRAYHRTLKLARTIADLDESETLRDEHLLEALQYRPRNIFG